MTPDPFPLPPGHQAQYDGTHREKNYLQFVRRLVERYSRLTVIDGWHADYPTTAFIDSVHLDRTGEAAAASIDRVLRPAGGGLPRAETRRSRFARLAA